MALKFLESQTMFYSKVFGPLHPVTEKVKALVAQGATFKVELYALSATYKGKPAMLVLTAGTTALMKGTVEATVAVANTAMIESWVSGLFTDGAVQTPGVTVLGVQQGAPFQPNFLVVIKAIRLVTGFGLAVAKGLGDQIVKEAKDTFLPLAPGLSVASAVTTLEMAGVLVLGHSTILGAPVTKPTDSVADYVIHTPVKPVSQVIDLKDAKALGQKVHGTSSGSVYYTVALNKFLKIAARVQGQSIAIRAEWLGDPTSDLKKLEHAGIQMKGNYASMHFDAAGVPPQRILGAFLLGTGVQWTAMITSGADLVVA